MDKQQNTQNFKRISLLILVLLPSLFQACFSQQKYSGQILNASNKTPIPYVNIWIKDTQTGTTSNMSGHFQLFYDDVSKSKFLALSAIGYKDTLISLSHFNKLIYLEPKNYELPEVTVKKPKSNPKKIIINRLIKMKLGGFLNSDGMPTIYGVYFPYKTKYKESKILSISMFLYNISDSKFNIRLYSFDTTNCQIIHELVHENIIVNGKKSKTKKLKFMKKEVDLSKFNVSFPKTGILVAIEWLIIPDNKYYGYMSNDKTGKYSMGPWYGPSIGSYVGSSKFAYRFEGGEWKEPKLVSKNVTLVYRPALSLEIIKQ